MHCGIIKALKALRYAHRTQTSDENKRGLSPMARELRGIVAAQNANFTAQSESFTSQSTIFASQLNAQSVQLNAYGGSMTDLTESMTRLTELAMRNDIGHANS
jgi:hypothetical protein